MAQIKTKKPNQKRIKRAAKTVTAKPGIVHTPNAPLEGAGETQLKVENTRVKKRRTIDRQR